MPPTTPDGDAQTYTLRLAPGDMDALIAAVRNLEQGARTIHEAGPGFEAEHARTARVLAALQSARLADA